MVICQEPVPQGFQLRRSVRATSAHWRYLFAVCRRHQKGAFFSCRRLARDESTLKVRLQFHRSPTAKTRPVQADIARDERGFLKRLLLSGAINKIIDDGAFHRQKLRATKFFSRVGCIHSDAPVKLRSEVAKTMGGKKRRQDDHVQVKKRT